VERAALLWPAPGGTYPRCATGADLTVCYSASDVSNAMKYQPFFLKSRQSINFNCSNCWPNI